MTIYAVIKTEDNICDNMIVWEDTLGPWAPPLNHYIVNNDSGAGDIGWIYDPVTYEWVAPPTPVPPAPNSENEPGPVVL